MLHEVLTKVELSKLHNVITNMDESYMKLQPP